MKTPLLKVGHRRVLADWVAASLQEAILNGYFEPGEKLDQDRIAEEFEVSRTPVREALQKLESEGFVEIRPHYGAYIPTVSRQDIREIYELRRLLEAETVRQVTPLIPESVLDELDNTLANAEERFEAGDTYTHFATDIHFHETILNFAESRLLKEVLDGLSNRISAVRRFALSKPGPHLDNSMREHRAILQAIRQRDPEQAAELMKLHLENSSLRIQELAEQRANGTLGG